MRKLASLLLLAFALPLLAASYGTIVIRDGDRHYSEGDSADIAAVADLGRQYAFFERDGVAYVIRDIDTLTRMRQILKPQMDLGDQQARLGSEQAALGAKQAAVGMRQATLGLKQAQAAGNTRARELSAQQSELSRQQQKFSELQTPLAERQRVLSEKQSAAGKTAKRQLEKLFEESIRNGLAKRK